MVTNGGGVVRLIDMIFPGDTNHHGTLFGGVALAHMDKVAFLAASRHGRAPLRHRLVRTDRFAAPALKGELIEATGRVVRVGTSALDVEVELVAEALLSGERRTCTRAFHAGRGEGPGYAPAASAARCRPTRTGGWIAPHDAWCSRLRPITTARCSAATP